MGMDPKELAKRLPRRASSASEPSESSGSAISEQSISQAIETARYWKNQFLRG